MANCSRNRESGRSALRRAEDEHKYVHNKEMTVNLAVAGSEGWPQHTSVSMSECSGGARGET